MQNKILKSEIKTEFPKICIRWKKCENLKEKKKMNYLFYNLQ